MTSRAEIKRAILFRKVKNYGLGVPFSYEAGRELKPKFGKRSIATKQTMSLMRRKKVEITLAKVELPE